MVWIFAPTQWGQIYERYWTLIENEKSIVQILQQSPIEGRVRHDSGHGLNNTHSSRTYEAKGGEYLCIQRNAILFSAIRYQSTVLGEISRSEVVLSGEKRKQENINIRFQSVSQIFPFVFCFTLFEYVTPLLESDFGLKSIIISWQFQNFRPLSLHNCSVALSSRS